MREHQAWTAGALAFATGVLIGCGAGEAPKEGASATKAGAGVAAATAWNPDAWKPPTMAEVPNDSMGAAIRRGYALMTATHDSLPQYVPSSLRCVSCHLDGGTRATAAPLTGAYARFPKYMDRTGAVIPLEDRINYCFTRSLAGSKIPTTSREMGDLVAYIAYISKDVPVGRHFKADGLLNMPNKLVGDPVRGQQIFATTCSRCHGADGQGTPPAFPAVWGPKSYSIGASMAREERAASFIFHNMPFDRAVQLTEQQAFDVSAFVNSHARPDSPEKEKDWPVGGAPYDVPYATQGHVAYKPPPVIPRPGSPQTGIVAPPAPIGRGK